MLIWLILLALVAIFIVTSLIRLEHEFKAVKAIIVIAILLLLVGSIFAWWQSSKADLNSPKGIANSIYSYVTWVADLGLKLFDVTKIGVVTVGNAIKGEENQTVTNQSNLGKK